MIKKISYRNNLPKKQIYTTNGLPGVGISLNSSENSGRNGWKLPGETGIQELTNPEDLIEGGDMTVSDSLATIEHFTNIADALDSENLESEANFIDFLIHKFAQATIPMPSEEERYIEYIYKIYNSDMPNSIDKIKKLTLDYSEMVASLIAQATDKNSSKKTAYNKVMLMGKKDA